MIINNREATVLTEKIDLKSHTQRKQAYDYGVQFYEVSFKYAWFYWKSRWTKNIAAELYRV